MPDVDRSAAAAPWGRELAASSARSLAIAAGLLLVAGLGYLAFWPVAARPVAWAAPTPPGYAGAHTPNTGLAGLNLIELGDEFGSEHIAFGPDGKLYAAMTSGALFRMDARRRQPRRLRQHRRTGARLRFRRLVDA